jgi:hypothetical protein
LALAALGEFRLFRAAQPVTTLYLRLSQVQVVVLAQKVHLLVKTVVLVALAAAAAAKVFLAQVLEQLTKVMRVVLVKLLQATALVVAAAVLIV